MCYKCQGVVLILQSRTRLTAWLSSIHIPNFLYLLSIRVTNTRQGMNRISKCWSKSQVHLSTLQSKGSVGRGVFCGGVGFGHGIHTDGRQGPTPYQPLSTPPPPPVAIVTLFISSTLSAFPTNLYQLMKHFPFPSGFSSELISISFISSPGLMGSLN